MHLKHHPFPSPLQGPLPARVQAIPGGCPSRPTKTLSLLCYSPKPSSSMGVEGLLFFFFPLLEAKPAWVSLLAKGAYRCSCVQPQAGYSKHGVREPLPSYFLSICPCFLICAVGRALFQGPASPHDSKGRMNTKNREPPPAEPLMWDENRSKLPSMWVRVGRERSRGKPRDSTGHHDRIHSGITTWLSTAFLKSCSAKTFTSGIRSII